MIDSILRAQKAPYAKKLKRGGGKLGVLIPVNPPDVWRRSYAFFGLKNMQFLGIFWLVHWPIKGPRGDRIFYMTPKFFLKSQNR